MQTVRAIVRFKLKNCVLDLELGVGDAASDSAARRAVLGIFCWVLQSVERVPVQGHLFAFVLE